MRCSPRVLARSAWVPGVAVASLPTRLLSQRRYAQLLWASLWSEQSAATHSLLRSLFPSLQFSPGTKTLQDELDTGVGGAASMLIKPQPAPKGPRIVLDGQVGVCAVAHVWSTATDASAE